LKLFKLNLYIISLTRLNSEWNVIQNWIQSEYNLQKYCFISSTRSFWSTEIRWNPCFHFIDKNSWLSGKSSFSKEMWNITKLFLMSSKHLLTFQNSWLSERVFVSVYYYFKLTMIDWLIKVEWILSIFGLLLNFNNYHFKN
jgi:hypothetical protein